MAPHKQTRLVLDFSFHLVHSQYFFMAMILVIIADHLITDWPSHHSNSSCSLVLHYPLLCHSPLYPRCHSSLTLYCHTISSHETWSTVYLYHAWKLSSDWLWLTLNGRKRWRKGSESPEHLLPAPRFKQSTFPHISPLTQPSHDWY